MTKEQLKELILIDYNKDNDALYFKIVETAKSNAISYFKEAGFSDHDDPSEKDRILGILNDEDSFSSGCGDDSYEDLIRQIKLELSRHNPKLENLINLIEAESINDLSAKEILAVFSEIDSANMELINDAFKYCAVWYFQS